jgi:hypothetical protein
MNKNPYLVFVSSTYFSSLAVNYSGSLSQLIIIYLFLIIQTSAKSGIPITHKTKLGKTTKSKIILCFA